MNEEERNQKKNSELIKRRLNRLFSEFPLSKQLPTRKDKSKSKSKSDLEPTVARNAGSSAPSLKRTKPDALK